MPLHPHSGRQTEQMKHTRLIIIGAGASGLYLSGRIPHSILIERQRACALKLLMTGNGQGNITTDESLADFLTHYHEKKSFVTPSLSAFPPAAIREFFRKRGVETLVREDGRVFPSAGRSSVLRDALLSEAGEIITENRVLGVSKKDGLFRTETEKGIFLSDFLVISTGGASYPKTGSSGDGYVFAGSFGHRIITPHPALSSLIIDPSPSSLEGVSLDSVTLSSGSIRKSGALVFTHDGISGPAAESISRYISGWTEISVSFKNGFHAADMKGENGKTNAVNALKKITNLPRSLLVYLFPTLSGRNTASVTKEEMKEIGRKISNLRLKAKCSPLEKATVTCGGVDTAEIDRRTMESKIVSGLYFTGEVIDVDGECGGYNLSFAFASAEAAARDILRKL